MGNRNIWDEIYSGENAVYGMEPEYKLVKYLHHATKGRVLDIGCGEGRNSLFFAENGFEIDGIDISEVAINKCKQTFAEYGYAINLKNADLKNLSLTPNSYSVIIVAWVLNFFKGAEVVEIIEKLKRALSPGGLIYIGVFSTRDPKMAVEEREPYETEKNTFYDKQKKHWVHYFDKHEIMVNFKGYTVISISEELYLEGSGKAQRHRGVLEFLGKK